MQTRRIIVNRKWWWGKDKTSPNWPSLQHFTELRRCDVTKKLQNIKLPMCFLSRIYLDLAIRSFGWVWFGIFHVFLLGSVWVHSGFNFNSILWWFVNSSGQDFGSSRTRYDQDKSIQVSVLIRFIGGPIHDCITYLF